MKRTKKTNQERIGVKDSRTKDNWTKLNENHNRWLCGEKYPTPFGVGAGLDKP